MKHIKSKDQFILDEGISWEALRSTYRRARGIASKVINAFKQEGRETASMMRVFNYQLRNKLRLDTRGNTPTPDEIKSALEQLKDIPKLAPYAVILLASPIPFSSTMYTAAAVYLKKVSKGYIDLLPGSFNDVFTPISDIDDKGYIENDEIDEKNMKFLKYFHLFESSNWKFTFPKTDSELNSMLEGPAGKSLREINQFPDEMRYGTPSISQGKSIQIWSGAGYDLIASLQGNIVYGTMRVYPSVMPVHQSLEILIDFLTIYLFCISKRITYHSVEEFVYLGKPLSLLIYNKCILRPKQFEVIIGIAKKYNGNSNIESIISKIKSDSDSNVPFSQETLNKSRAYRFFDEVFKFSIGDGNSDFYQINGEYFVPFGIKGTGRDLYNRYNRGMVIYIPKNKFNYKKEDNAIKFIDKQIIDKVRENLRYNYRTLNSDENGELIKNLAEALLEVYNSGTELLYSGGDLYSRIRDILDSVRLKNPVLFSEFLQGLSNIAEFKELADEYIEKYQSSFRSGNILSRFRK
jgi:hypothetical protein